ncbi:metalloprotease [Batrachochytrium dendrobatidis]|nr:metalloprotease [Batrachochytrium dendrobatidis]KAK5665628.1 metalloprotease [Batrachochytrium dendrobatidis]
MTSFKPPTFFSGNVLKPDEDNRDYQIITLANGLQAVVISDPSTDKAAAAMDVHVGHLCDPEGVAGLAHFCEHLHYHFEVSASNLEGALDRFAQFFICPLFSESGTDRELNAVDSEHKKNIQVDTWRNYQLQKDLCNPKHPFVKFGTGNLETLKDIPLSKGMNLRKVLLEFHDKYYSANIMKLAVVGKEPIETLVEWVASKFSDVKNKSIDVPIFSNDALTAAELQKEILVKPVKETRTLTLTFPCADTRKLYKCSDGLMDLPLEIAVWALEGLSL